VSPVDLGGGVRSNALRRVLRIDCLSVPPVVVVGCDDLPIGVASDKVDAPPERHQAIQDLGWHRTGDHVPADHHEIRIHALEVRQDRLQSRQVAVDVIDGRNARTLLYHTSSMIALVTELRGRLVLLLGSDATSAP
jgi:hypothetical protein